MDISQISFFEGIDNEVIQKLKENCSEKSFEKDEIIFEKGSSAAHLYFLKDGKIDLFLKEQNRSICLLTEPGEVFGWSAIVENGVYTSSSICKEKTSALMISKEALKDIFTAFPQAAVIFYQRIGSVFSKRLSNIIE